MRHTPFPYDIADLGLSDDDRAAAYAPLFEDFVAIVRRLRRECPWDVQQTHDSTFLLTIEELAELVDAIDAGDPADVQKELGDLFLHVLFHAHIAETDGTFDLSDVMRSEMTKLVRRHPHVFGDEVVSGTGEVLRNWEAIKRAERAEAGETEAPPSALDGVPGTLPALLRAERVQEKAAATGFDFPSADDAWEKVREEAGEVRAAASADALEDEIGDLLFAVVNLARRLGCDPEQQLRRTNAKFERRFRRMEALLAEDGKKIDGLPVDEVLDVYWTRAKKEE